MEIYCRVTDTGFVPLDDNDWEQKKLLRIGSDVRCTISQPRNIKFHRKFFALLTITFDNLPETIQGRTNITSIESLLSAIKIDLGYFDTVNIKGREIARLRSISFAKMSEQDFERFYNLAITDILSNYLCGTDRQALIDEVRQFIGY